MRYSSFGRFFLKDFTKFFPKYCIHKRNNEKEKQKLGIFMISYFKILRDKGREERGGVIKNNYMF